MKIGGSIEKAGSSQGLTRSDDKRTAGDSGIFLQQLKWAENKSLRDKIGVMLLNIQEQGEKLGKRADISDMKVYKKLISEFLAETVHQSRQFSSESFLDRRGRHKVYAVIKRIDESLEALTEEVLKKEKDRLAILQKLDDIRGLLLDLAL